jgi:hypothetical protein
VTAVRARTKAKLGGIAVLVAGIAFFANPNCDIDWYNVTVTDKQVKMMDGQDVYLIFSVQDDGSPRVFKDVDSKLFFKFSSSDIYAKMQMGKRYRVKTSGWRWGMKSWYENILKVEALPDQPGTALPR